jgi:hypothetical protein
MGGRPPLLPARRSRRRWRRRLWHFQPGATVAKAVEDGGEGAPGYSSKEDVPLHVPGVRPPDEADGVAHAGVIARLEEIPPPCVVVGGGLDGIGALLGLQA